MLWLPLPAIPEEGIRNAHAVPGVGVSLFNQSGRTAYFPSFLLMCVSKSTTRLL